MTRDATNFYSYRARINLTTDWRTQTDYGVLCACAAIIAQQSTRRRRVAATSRENRHRRGHRLRERGQVWLLQ